MPVGVRRMHDGRVRAEASFAVEELDRPQAGLRDALVDLARLLVGVHVQDELVLGGVTTELAQRAGRTRTHGVGGDADADPIRAQRFELAQIYRHRLLAEP